MNPVPVVDHPTMNNSIFWVALAAYAIHILEEFFYDWRSWAQRTLKIPVDWTGFYLTNSAVLFLGIACAGIGWSNPLLSLAYPGLMLINGVFFHILPVVLTKRFSPGLITACLLFLPVCFLAFRQALAMNVSVGIILQAIGVGALLMAYPILLLRTKDLPFFDQKI